jgi:hypothetical protein
MKAVLADSQAERGGARAPGAGQQQQQQQQQAGGYKPPTGADLTQQSAEEEFQVLRREEDARMRAQATAESRERLAVATARKEQVKAAVGAMLLPNNPLDQLIDMLGGPDQIAEMTGTPPSATLRHVLQILCAGVPYPGIVPKSDAESFRRRFFLCDTVTGV